MRSGGEWCAASRSAPRPTRCWRWRNFRGDSIRYLDAAPLEDLLYEAHRMLADSRAKGRSARLLLVAGRRAHPRILGPDMVQPCPSAAIGAG